MLGAVFVRSPSRRFHAVIAALPLAIWTLFHLWEQWAAFAGSDAWLARMRTTSEGAIAIAIEVVAIALPLAIWAALTLRAAIRREPLPGAAATGDRGFALALGRLAPIACVVALLFLAIHVGHLWGPKIVRGASALESWAAITHDLGRPWMLVLYAIGLAAIALHIAVSIPAALVALGWIASDEARRQALLVSSVLALSIWVLAVQLTGWVATGTGTFWAIDVVEAPPADIAP
jgi:succinate dehydrogenase/fumarate reductase cytochrome b subunit